MTLLLLSLWLQSLTQIMSDLQQQTFLSLLPSVNISAMIKVITCLCGLLLPPPQYHSEITQGPLTQPRFCPSPATIGHQYAHDNDILQTKGLVTDLTQSIIFVRDLNKYFFNSQNYCYWRNFLIKKY